MKICFVLEYYLPHIGGAEILFSNLSERLVKMGHECYIITSKLPQTKKYEEINGVKIHRVRVPYKLDRYWFTFFSIPTVYKLCINCDFVHCMTYNSAFPAWLIAKILKKPSIITVYEVHGSTWKNLSDMNQFNAKLHQILEKLIISLNFDKYICISMFTGKSLSLEGVNDNKIKIIYPGVDYDLFDPSKADGVKIRDRFDLESNFIYMSYGRPGASKGIEYLIKSVPLISTKIPKSKLLLILAKDPKNRYHKILKMINNLNINNYILLLEPVPRDELPDYINCSNCIVVPSLSEGFGFTAAEACGMEKPIVATDEGSLPEVVSGRYVLVQSKDPEAIADGVVGIYNGNFEYKDKKIFGWDACVEEHIKIYKSFQET